MKPKLLHIAAFWLVSTGGHAADPLAVSRPLAPMEIAITVDDIPSHEDSYSWMSHQKLTHDLLAGFKAEGIGEVYGFVNGSSLKDEPQDWQVLRDWLAAGYPLANHAFTHPDLNEVSARRYVEEIAQTDQLLGSLEKKYPLASARKYFRYPFLHEGSTLARRVAVRKYLAQQGYQIAQVTIDYADWAWNSAYLRCRDKKNTPAMAQVQRQFVEAARRSLRRSQGLAQLLYGHDIRHVLLLHHAAIEALSIRNVLQSFKTDGVRFIDLKTALADPIYRADPQVVSKEPGTFLEQQLTAQKIEDPFEESKYPLSKIKSICR